VTRTVVPKSRLRAGSGDDFPTKLVKYIPGETLAFFVPTAALLGEDRSALLVTVALIGAAGNIGYLWYLGRSEPVDRQPRAHFYILAVFAFVAWALVTAPNLAAMAGLDQVASSVILAIAVFAVPLIDGVTTSLRPSV
jgi:hypothetical protein